MDTSLLDLPTLRVKLEQILSDRVEFNASGIECQQQIQQTQTQIQNLNARVTQLKGALAYMDLAEKRVRAEIAAHTAAVTGMPAIIPTIVTPVAAEVTAPSA